jgi:hypothetical protein
MDFDRMDLDRMGLGRVGAGSVPRSGSQVGVKGSDDAGERRNYCRDGRLPNPRWIPLPSRAARKIREIGRWQR